MLLENLDNLDRVQANLADLVVFQKKCEAALELVKAKVKYNKTDLPFPWGVVKFSSYKKFKPKDLDEVMKRYPIVMNRDFYNISLAAKAAEVITDDDIFDIEMVDRISFTLNPTATDGQVNDSNQNNWAWEIH